MTRECNTQPCQAPVHELPNREEAQPILKVSQLTTRKQRFTACVIKEGDLEWMREDMQMPEGIKKPRFPVRVVLNNMTLSVFTANHFDTITFGVNLLAIKTIENHPEDEKACFVITSDDNKRIVLCSMLSDTSDTPENIKKEWVKQIYFFKNHCHTEHAVHFFDGNPQVKIKRLEIE